MEYLHNSFNESKSKMASNTKNKFDVFDLESF